MSMLGGSPIDNDGESMTVEVEADGKTFPSTAASRLFMFDGRDNERREFTMTAHAAVIPKMITPVVMMSLFLFPVEEGDDDIAP